MSSDLEGLRENLKYRGYTIVTMMEPRGEIRIQHPDGEYLQFPEISRNPFRDYEQAMIYIDAAIKHRHLPNLCEPAVRVGISPYNHLELVVSTEGGDIQAESLADEDYPAIDIKIDGRTYVTVEWCVHNQQFNLRVFAHDNEDTPYLNVTNMTRL